jgi:hypothetical protein
MFQNSVISSQRTNSARGQNCLTAFKTIILRIRRAGIIHKVDFRQKSTYRIDDGVMRVLLYTNTDRYAL